MVTDLMERWYDYWVELGVLSRGETHLSEMHLVETTKGPNSVAGTVQWGKTINPTTPSTTWRQKLANSQ